MIDAPLVWETQEQPAPSVLQSWAATRGLRLVAPAPGGMHAVAVDPSDAKPVEELLHAARELVTQHDAEGAERALARAEAAVRAHPELPQAPWLLAEVMRGWATRFARVEPTDPARAARDWRAAAALDGGREAGLGEPAAAPEARVPFSLEVTGASPALELTLDAEPIAPGAHEAKPGLHRLLARSGESVVFAEWIAIVSPHAVVRVALPPPAPCSADDLASRSPACPTWVTARPGPQPGAYVVRVCGQSGCGPELAVASITETPSHPVVVRHGLPTWATVTLVTGGVILAGIAAGAIGWAALPTKTEIVWQQSPPAR